jgi:hypothetical protein
MRPSLRLGRGFARLSLSTRRQREEEKRRRREAGGQPTTGARSPRSEGRGTQSGGISKRGGNRGVGGGGGGGEERRRRWGMVRRVPPALRYFPLFSSTYRPRQPPPLFHLSPGSRRSPRKPPSPSKAGREPPSSSTDEDESDEEEPSPKSVPARSSQEKEEEEEEEEEPKKDEDYDSDLLESSDYDDGDDDVDDADSGGVLVFEARRGPFRARVRRTLDRRYTNHRIGVKVYQVRFGVVRERGAELDAVDAGIFHLYGLLEEVSVLVKGDEKKGWEKGAGLGARSGGARARKLAGTRGYRPVPAGTRAYRPVPANVRERCPFARPPLASFARSHPFL